MEAETEERERVWSGDKSRKKSYIARLADEAREKTKFNLRERKNANVVNRAEVEAAPNIRFSAHIQGAKRERAEAEGRAKADSEIK